MQGFLFSEPFWLFLPEPASSLLYILPSTQVSLRCSLDSEQCSVNVPVSPTGQWALLGRARSCLSLCPKGMHSP